MYLFFFQAMGAVKGSIVYTPLYVVLYCGRLLYLQVNIANKQVSDVYIVVVLVACVSEADAV